jgi:hypothetical protein
MSTAPITLTSARTGTFTSTLRERVTLSAESPLRRRTCPGTTTCKAGSPYNSRLGGDTLWCRQTHLSLAGNANLAAFHCGHGTNPSLGICRDALVDGYTPYEWLRDGADTQHRLPFCDVANNGKVVDCTMGGVNTDNLSAVLESLPGTMEILFLNGNQITSITGPLADSLTNPLNLKALYLNDNGLESLAANTLEGLDNLEVFNADENLVVELADDFLSYTPKLKQFSMFHNYNLFSPSIPATFFSNTPLLEVISLYGTGITNFTEHTFDGLHNVKMFSFVTNGGITEASFPAGLFDDLTSVQFFDFFGTEIKALPDNFFGPWASKILRLAFWNTPIQTLGTAGLENLESIEMAYFHENRCDGGVPHYGASFDNFANVSNILTGINPLVTVTYGSYGGDARLYNGGTCSDNSTCCSDYCNNGECMDPPSEVTPFAGEE